VSVRWPAGFVARGTTSTASGSPVLCGRWAVRDLPETQCQHAFSRSQDLSYLLKGMGIAHPNQVWCADVCYIPMRRGFLCLVAIMDWNSRKVLSWRLANTLESDFCVAALKEALA
jgi:putative transposase